MCIWRKQSMYICMYDMFKLQLVCMARLTINPCECYCAEQYETWNKFLLRLLLFRVRQILTIAYLLFFFPRSIVCTQILQFTLNCKSRNEIIRRLNWTFFYYWGWSNNTAKRHTPYLTVIVVHHVRFLFFAIASS